MILFYGNSMRHNLTQPMDFDYNEAPSKLNDAYTFFHFIDSVEFSVNGIITVTNPNAVIIVDKKTGFSTASKSRHPIRYSWFRFTCNEDELRDKSIVLNQFFYPTKHIEVYKLTEKLQNIFFNKTNDSVQKIGNCELLSKTIEEILTNAFFEGRDISLTECVKERLSAVRSLIYQKYNERWTIDKMASCAGYSKFHFSRVYKSYFGISPNDELINIRMDKAKEYLFGTEYKASEIAKMLGYTDYTQFSRQFRRKVGVSPAEYRGKNRNFYVR